MTYTISAPPHKKTKLDFKTLNISKIIALIPLCLAAIYFFGIPALGIIIASVLAAVATEFGIQTIYKQKVTIADGHAATLGLMLALLIPPEAPLWIAVVGGFFAIAIGKHVFGGIGSYIFNPVLVSWVFIRNAWPSYMTPVSIPHIGQFSDLLFENGAGLMVGVSPILLIGGVYLIYKRYVDWKVPLAFLVTLVAIPQTLMFLSGVATLIHEGVLNPLMYMSQLFIFLEISPELPYAMIGAVFFGILFIATDEPTSPVTKNGRIIYGIVCGVLVFVYGYFGNYVDGVLYGIFLANCVGSYIELNTMPSSFGTMSLPEKIYRNIMDKIPSSLKFEVINNE
ncbi:Rnf electron transport complex subunit RnfD [Methanolobus bombayensis]|uniref:Rnf electron transport complex subunit RnfD n=1 Tax=Methanolobus bombayensis TaxID=38023 RepID=UPI001AEAC370|nr:Rnf electron transport complex subunit RnfD [Methanolobus bombayensis]MBP1909855.1 electron transport complex protein RnfD [Methanolobus bombayensis]